jgi:tripartite-type tricarboxylate transporter receptor subunit TctC
MRTIAKIAAGIMVGGGILISPTAAVAQSDYPNRPIKLIVGFAPGDSTDMVTRIVAQKLCERLGQPLGRQDPVARKTNAGCDRQSDSSFAESWRAKFRA